ncbi:M16 family metallopeptidase [Dokdonia sp. 4H-3-7-5]|uniref:M16 family metallopeptidase n=1 Tax=Dokdonia sp. (strain 4H-3-7-5) TaxID=983548 RepID=UPI00020A6FAF|nr:pitrilysin family protein [Dokdonia sp. 4H-3-7-5]AEE20776.1 peptidase M16 domain protein [Dokdonia sp. 4H-3-7-5]
MKKHIILGALLMLATAGYAQVDRSIQPKPGPAPEINLKDPTSFELKNGLKVMVVENKKLPRVSIQLTMNNPLIVEGDKAGVASLTSSMLGKGSKNIEKDVYEEEVDYLGANIGFGSQSAFASGLSKYFERLIELTADAGINPNFTQVEFDKEKERLIEGLKSNEKSVSAIAGRVQSVLAYGADHPYGEFTTEETVNNVTLADVNKFHSDYFRPNNGYLIIIGDVDFDNVKKIVTKNFKSWKKGNIPETPFSEQGNASTTEINFINMDNAVQSEIAVQNTVELKMTDADYFPALIANNILGGGGEARLFNNLREDKGYTYGSYSRIGSNEKTVTRFSATASVRNVVTDSSVVEIVKEINRMGSEPVSAEELANAKAKYTGNFVLALERPQTIANYAYNIESKGLPKDFYKNYLSNIDKVSQQDVQNAASKLFKGDNARIVVTGKGSEVIDNLNKVVINGKAVPVKYYDVYGKAIAKPEFKKELPADLTVNKVLESYIAAIGGKDKIAAVNSVYIKAQGTVQGMTLDFELKKTTKEQFVQNIMMGGNSLSKQVLDGETAYMVAQGQRKDLEGDDIAKVKAESSPFPEVNWLSGGATLEGMEKVDGEDAYVVKVDGGKMAYYSAKTGLKLQEVSVQEAQGQTFKTTIVYSKYQDVGGIMFPFTLSQSLGPQAIEFNVTEIKVNEGVSDADFE